MLGGFVAFIQRVDTMKKGWPHLTMVRSLNATHISPAHHPPPFASAVTHAKYGLTITVVSGDIAYGALHLLVVAVILPPTSHTAVPLSRYCLGLPNITRFQILLQGPHAGYRHRSPRDAVTMLHRGPLFSNSARTLVQVFPSLRGVAGR